MKRKTQYIFEPRAIVLLLAAAMALLLLSGIAESAENIVSISGKTVTDIQTEINSALTAAPDIEKVTVTGKLALADTINTTMELIIPAGKTVLWLADYSGTTSYSLIVLRSAAGAGRFKVGDGGFITQKGGGFAIYAIGNTSDDSAGITVSGGSVTKTGTDGITIRSDSNNADANIIISGGTVTSKANGAIISAANAGNITVTGGSIKSEAEAGTAIYANGASITISGGTVTSAGTEVSGGTINAGTGSLTVSGDAFIESTGVNRNAVYSTTGAVTITGGTVKASGRAINKVGGINSGETSGDINITGGTVRGARAIDMSGSPAYRLLITGGKITATGTAAINVGTSNVVSITGGEVTATGTAITAGRNCVVSITGGKVTAAGTGVSLTGTNGRAYIGGGEITGDPRIDVTGNNNAISIERTDFSNNHEIGTSDGLVVIPADAEAKWDIVDNNYIIRYTIGTNSGFIDVPVVSAAEIIEDDNEPITPDSGNSSSSDDISGGGCRSGAGAWFGIALILPPVLRTTRKGKKRGI